MNTERVIVAGTDFSDTAEHAVDYAVDLAKALDATVVVVNACELPVYGFPDAAMIPNPDMAADILANAQANLKEAVEKRRGPGVRIEGVVRQGVPWQEIEAV